MYCAVLRCTVLCCAAVYSAVLYCTVLCCTVLYCAVLFCSVLYCTVLCCAVLYCTVLYCTVLYCTALHLYNGESCQCLAVCEFCRWIISSLVLLPYSGYSCAVSDVLPSIIANSVGELSPLFLTFFPVRTSEFCVISAGHLSFRFIGYFSMKVVDIC